VEACPDVALGELGGGVDGPGKEATAQRAERDEADPKFVEDFQDGALRLAPEE